MIKRKSKHHSAQLDELDRASRDIESRIQELEASLKRPGRKMRMPDDHNTLPPLERTRESAQIKALRSAVARNGRAVNSRRELREPLLLLSLLICAVAASFFWILRLMEQQ